MTATTIGTVRDEIYGLLKAKFDTLTPAPAIVYDDSAAPRQPDGAKPWLRARVRHNPNAGGEDSLGPAGKVNYERLGVVLIQVFTPFGDGYNVGDLYATMARDAYEGQATPSGVWFRNCRIAEGEKSGQFQQTNVSVEFVYNEYK